ncbi:MAG: hypothetical protein GX477_10485 [Clostridiaceae bacterium]|nr:hypothetical protein [Clostridiaceae bacterium]
MSIASCVVIAVLFLVRLIRPIPRRYIYPLWALFMEKIIVGIDHEKTMLWSIYRLKKVK